MARRTRATRAAARAAAAAAVAQGHVSAPAIIPVDERYTRDAGGQGAAARAAARAAAANCCHDLPAEPSAAIDARYCRVSNRSLTPNDLAD